MTAPATEVLSERVSGRAGADFDLSPAAVVAGGNAEGKAGRPGRCGVAARVRGGSGVAVGPDAIEPELVRAATRSPVPLLAPQPLRERVDAQGQRNLREQIWIRA